MSEIFVFKKAKNCRKKCKNAKFEKRSSLYFKFALNQNFRQLCCLMAEEIVNKHIILEFVYEKIHRKWPKKYVFSIFFFVVDILSLFDVRVGDKRT